MKLKLSFIIFSLGFLSLFLPITVFAQSEFQEAKVVNSLPDGRLELIITQGLLKGDLIQVETQNPLFINQPQYQLNDQVLVGQSLGYQGQPVFYITDFIRRNQLLWLFVIFIGLTVLISGWQGFNSLLSLGVSFFIIFKLMLPKLLAGADPVQTAVFSSLIIIPVTFYLSHGLNRKTTIAIISTIISLIITSLLADFFVQAARLTGFAAEEAGFLQVAKDGLINMQGLLLAGIIIGVLGVLDDITVSQSAIVQQLKQANPKLKFTSLYRQAMMVGRDHIASMVNTLILVYTGAALPLLLLFINNPHPFTEIINYEIIADEVVRTLVGSLGLILAVPITTILAVFVFNQKDQKK